MSQGKFASITASLLARKGEAAPWQQSQQTPLAWRSQAAPEIAAPAHPSAETAHPPAETAHLPATPRKVPALPPQPPTSATKRCTVRLSQNDYERLGLMAVKKDIKRQQLLQEALAEVLARMARDFAQSCACISKACAGDCS
jgi:hypothetical protein